MSTTTLPTAAPRRTSARPTLSGGSGRDLRVDFLRGACLLFMLWNHIFWAAARDMPFFLQLTPLHWGLSNAADGFVFLSGLVFGRVYMRVHERGGVRAIAAKAAVRVWQLYVANLVAMFLALAAVSVLLSNSTEATATFSARLSLEELVAPSEGAFFRLAALRAVPWGFDVLPLYMLLLPIGAVYIVLLRHGALPVLALAVGLYGLAQAGVNLPALKPWSGMWFFNPFAWQLLFACGILLGARVLRVRRRPAWIGAAGATIGSVAVCVWLLPKLARHVPGADDLLFQFPLAGITNLEPVRLLYFLTLAYLVWCVTDSEAPMWSSGWANPVVLLGQHSLEVFLFGQVFTYAMALALVSMNAGWPLVAGAALAGCGSSMLFARVVRARRALG